MSSEGIIGSGEHEAERRIYEVTLTDEQFNRFEERAGDGVADLRYVTPNDVLQHCPEGMLAHFLWSDKEGEVIIPGKDVAWWLDRLDEISVSEGEQPWRKPYAEAYSSHPRKGYAIPVEQVNLAEPASLE